MITEGVTDYRRYKNDNKINAQRVKRINLPSLDVEETTAEHIKVGDVLKLDNDEQVPADCMVLSTGDANGQCYISTSQLDGERNLKPKLAPMQTQ